MTTHSVTTDQPSTEIRALAEHVGVCVRPIVRRVTDYATGEQHIVPIPCGSTRERVCKPCADKARKVRIQQCREGWHRTDEPEHPGVDVPDLTGQDLASAAETAGHLERIVVDADPVPAPAELVVSGRRYEPDLDPDTIVEQSPKPGRYASLDGEISVVVSSDDEGDRDEGLDPTRRRRSTRRRDDAAELPKAPMADTTLGRTFTGKDGRTHQPSMFLTFTLPSYGPVLDDGTPRHPNTYDYRRAALDALHFPKVVDRLIQNLRRCAGYNAQYFATVEPQKRLALHLHAAVRGTIPRSVVRQVVDATYHQVWWPNHDHPVYTGGRLPIWDDTASGYVDPTTRHPLQTWNQALDELDDDPDAEPAHVVRPGSQHDYQGIIGTNERQVSRSVGYLTKYLTKSVAETYDPDTISQRQKQHRDRLHAEVRLLPCTPECANWLRYGIQPKTAGPGLFPGECDKPAHHPDNLGHGGRRVLASRDWSGKRLPEHKADRATVVQQALDAAGVDMPPQHRYPADELTDDGEPRYTWEPVDVTAENTPTAYRDLVRQTIRERIRWRNEYNAAKLRAGPPDTRSATQPAAQAA